MEKWREPEEAEKLSRADEWFLKNNERIAEIMEAQRIYALSLGDDRTYFDREKLSLSEMPLCWSIADIDAEMKLAGFSVLTAASGFVQVVWPALGYQGSDGVGHAFYFNRRLELVVCLTFGQFVLPMKESTRPMEKIEFVAGLAPELVVVAPEVAMLRGNVAEIAGKTGLIYRPRKSDE